MLDKRSGKVAYVVLSYGGFLGMGDKLFALPWSIAIGDLIGIIIAVIASMMVAGYAAGYLGRWYSPQRNLGILYGFTTWSVALLLSAVVAAPISHYATTYFNVMNGGTALVINKKPNGTAALILYVLSG